jgi:RNA polymerase sigma-70 factor (ECF subfamily)
MFDQCFEPVLAYARRRAHNTDQAQEVVDETFTTAWRRFDDIPEDALPWLYGVARRVLANQFRSTRRRDALFSRLSAEPRSGGSPADPAEVVSERDALVSSLAGLKPEDREILLLASWEGLEPARGAEVLGISPDAFTARLHRARRRLQARLDASGAWAADDEGTGEAT